MCQNKQYNFVSSIERLPSLYPVEETTDVLKIFFNKGLLICIQFKIFWVKAKTIHTNLSISTVFG